MQMELELESTGDKKRKRVIFWEIKDGKRTSRSLSSTVLPKEAAEYLKHLAHIDLLEHLNTLPAEGKALCLKNILAA